MVKLANHFVFGFIHEARNSGAYKEADFGSSCPVASINLETWTKSKTTRARVPSAEHLEIRNMSMLRIDKCAFCWMPEAACVAVA